MGAKERGEANGEGAPDECFYWKSSSNRDISLVQRTVTCLGQWDDTFHNLDLDLFSFLPGIVF